jgi:hypothetical protein
MPEVWAGDSAFSGRLVGVFGNRFGHKTIDQFICLEQMLSIAFGGK